MISISEDTLNVIYLYIPSCALGFGLVLNLLTLAALLRAIGCLANGSTGTSSSDSSEAAAATSNANSSVGTRLVPRTHFLVVVLLANDVLVLLTRPALDLFALALISTIYSASNRAPRARFAVLDWVVCRVGLFMQQCVASFNGWLPVLIVGSHVLRSENAFLQTIYPASSGGGRTRARTVSFRDDLRQLVVQASERSRIFVKIAVSVAVSLICVLHVHTLWIYQMDFSLSECNIHFAHHSFFRTFWTYMLHLLDVPLPLIFFYMALVASVVNCVYQWFTGWRTDNRADQTSNSRISEQQRAFSEGRQLVRATAALHALVYTPFVLSELLISNADSSTLSFSDAEAGHALLKECLNAAVVLHHAVLLPLVVLLAAASVRSAFASRISAVLHWCAKRFTLEPYSRPVAWPGAQEQPNETATIELRHADEHEAQPMLMSQQETPTAERAEGEQVVIELEMHTPTAKVSSSQQMRVNSMFKSRDHLRSYNQIGFIDEPQSDV